MRFWHSYDHPDSLPDPDRETALAAPLRAFPSWYIRTTCAACGWERHASQTQILVADERWGDRPIRDVLAAIRCSRCGARVIPLGRGNIS